MEVNIENVAAVQVVTIPLKKLWLPTEWGCHGNVLLIVTSLYLRKSVELSPRSQVKADPQLGRLGVDSEER
eukprot:3244372-Ditylum_brightwellii.AAC.1